MTDMERMMADILGDFEESTGQTPPDSAPQPEEEEVYFSPVPPKRKPTAPENADGPKAKAVQFDPVNIDSRADASASAYSRTLKEEREKKIARESKKRGIRPAAVILILCAALVIGAILLKALSEDFAASMPWTQKNEIIPLDQAGTEEAEAGTEEELPQDIIIPTPDPNDENVKIVPPGTIVIMSDTNEAPENLPADSTVPGNPETALPAREHSYEFIREDVSWTQAQQRCYERGGHLANISDEAERQQIITLAEQNGVEKIWVGCHRENAQLIWENDEQVEYYVWGKGEPSGYDSGDRVTEDYLLLWKFNGEWVYNDSRDDPVKDYPDMYSGQIGFVCEYEASDGTQQIVPLDTQA